MTLSELSSRLSGGLKKHGEGVYAATCPIHKGGHERTPSLMIKESPDGALTVTCFAGCDRKEVLDRLGITFADLKPSTWKNKSDIVETYTYVNAKDEYMFEKVRLEPKSFRLCRFVDGERIWGLKDVIPASDWPLYRLPEVIKDIKDGNTIVFVEGEKDVDRLRRMGIAATTLASGSGATVWKQPSGQKAVRVLSKGRVVFIPDNDEPGKKFVDAGHKAISKSAILNLEGLAEAGDVSDWLNKNGNTKESLIALVDGAYGDRPGGKAGEDVEHGDFFAPLGYDRGVYYFMSFLEQQVVEIQPKDFARKTTLYRLAPKRLWEDYFWAGRALDVDSAADFLMTICRVKGIYNYRGIRGRGVWMDKSRVIIHNGDHLIVDGEKNELIGFNSKYVYERERPIALSAKNPMPSKPGIELVDLCSRLSWVDPVSGKLLAGWLFLAPICGALMWRPHIWIVGAAGSGKTWIFNEIINRLLGGGIGVFAQSTATEAGLRQDIKNDAIPVIFDEAEADTKRNKVIIDRVLELARQASSNSAGSIMKGSTGGKTVFFNIQSMFCFISVNKDHMKKADQSRIAALPLRPPVIRGSSADEFEELVSIKKELMTDGFQRGFIARSCASVVEIRNNINLISSMFEGQVQRNIDQYGAMIAGLWSLTNNGNINRDFVGEIVDEIEASESIEFADTEKDETNCLNVIMECVISAEMGSVEYPRRQDKTLGELIDTCDPGYMRPQNLPQAQVALNHYGIKTNENGVLIANRNKELSNLLRNTQFQHSWSTFLLRLDGSSKTGTIRFAGKVVQRATLIPWEFFRDAVEGVEEDDISAV